MPKEIWLPVSKLIKVTDAKTSRLKRWEFSTGTPLAIMSSGTLKFTEIGGRTGYKIKGKQVLGKVRKKQK